MMKRDTTRGATRSWLPPLGALLVLVVLALNLSGGVVVRAAGYNWATFTDNAKLFTQTGKNDIATTARQANLRVYIVTTGQSFSTRGAWHTWLTNQARQEGDRGAVTIGFLDAGGKQHDIYAVHGPDTGLTNAQTGQGVNSAQATFKSSGVTAGVIQMIHNYQSYGASSPGAGSAPANSNTGQGTGSAAPANSGSQGFGFGWLIPVIIVLAIAFVAFRLLRPRRPVVPPYNPNLSGGPYGNPNNQVGPNYGNQVGPGYGNQVGPGGYVNQPGGYVGPNYGNNRGGGLGSGLAGGLAGGVVGGVVGSAIGNELFDHDRDGNDGNNAGGGNYGGDPNATNPGVTDTQNAQDAQGSWDTSGGGSWGGDSGGGGGDSGGSWGGDSGGGGDGGGGDGGSW